MEGDELLAAIEVGDGIEDAFARFLTLGSWWPRAYTWSGDALVALAVDARPGGLISELGPDGFRCDFGRILVIEPPRLIAFTWQIGPDRTPQPDPARASEVTVSFAPASEGGTEVTLAHRHFRRHGAGHDRYRESMAAEQGWPYMLRCFAGRAS